MKQNFQSQTDVIFYQLFESQTSTYTYILGDTSSKECAIIDPVLETVDRDLQLIEELGLKLKWILDTHVHADHITGAAELRKRTGAKTAVSQDAGVSCSDLPLIDGQELSLGGKKIKTLSTPGHTDSCMSFCFSGMVFTGDSLMIRSAGRTDFQQGSSDKLYDSVYQKLFVLPDETIVYPGHDYRGQMASTIGLEKKFNVRLGMGKSKEDFCKMMAELKLSLPKKIHEAVPANLQCGEIQDQKIMHPQIVDGVPEVNVDDVHLHMAKVKSGKVKLVDVRRPDEFNNELGHIEGATLVTLGPDLVSFLRNGNKDEEIVFVCRSGARSGNATMMSLELGYKKTMNMTGGMLRWNEKKLPTKTV